MPIMQISVVPVGTRSTSISKYIAASEKAVSGHKSVKSQLTPMNTIVESGSLRELMDIAANMHKNALKEGARRVLTSITIDDRLDKRTEMEARVRSVEEKMGKS
ncbi:MAG: MTH1187 family thiamine-binding protein [Candidatus Omnitrophica bacterium]|nr:MTH1187 family thiamine-binding protein [Candidatus Omnitrophota bacterium]MDD5553495.1 MTH1187 family thiamine-binding protein [Candidatus Omnitrophota bacterium]